MGTPREAIRLMRVSSAGGHLVRLVGVASNRDWTDAMVAFARRRLSELAELNLAGFVLKKNSPSCGLVAVPIFADDGALALDGVGLFAHCVRELLPGLPTADEEQLSDHLVRRRFLEEVREYHRRLTGL
jgi:uncharacterized protein YbbK (DUF523 family)